MVLRLTGSRSEVVFKQIAYPDVEVRVPDVSEMRNLGVTAEVGLEEGLQRTIDWWRMR
jgi:nucleoside-diphosphate-sugar epimerase